MHNLTKQRLRMTNLRRVRRLAAAEPVNAHDNGIAADAAVAAIAQP
jgi:hypothetical protein